MWRLRESKLELTGQLLRDPVKKKRIIGKVEAPDEWYTFCDEINTALEGLVCASLLPFTRQAHLSVGKYHEDMDRWACSSNLDTIEQEMGLLRGEIPLVDVRVWGMDQSLDVDFQRERLRIFTNSFRTARSRKLLGSRPINAVA